MLKFNKAATDKMATLLISAETFIVCHEVAHFLNGDLDNDDAFCALPDGMSGTMFVENINHQIEFKADCVGYDLYCQTLKAQGHPDDPQQLLAPLIFAFDGLYQLGDRGTATHPHPYERITQVVTRRYGEQAGRAIRDGLENPDRFPEAVSHLKGS